MLKRVGGFLCLFLVFGFFAPEIYAQEVAAKNSVDLKLSGRVQLQHYYNNQLRNEDSLTYHGFRIRRGRFQIDAQLTSFLKAKLQVEARDNSPRLKDAEATLKLFKNYYFRVGQFKVPVWREELRSSGDLLLVERSAASTFLIVNLLSARQPMNMSMWIKTWRRARRTTISLYQGILMVI